MTLPILDPNNPNKDAVFFPTRSVKVGDFVLGIKRQFGDQSGVQIVDTDIFRWINEGAMEILNKNPMLKASAETDVIKGTNSYYLPLNALRIESVQVGYNMLEAWSMEDAQRNLRSSVIETGVPRVWWMYASKFYIWPVPDEDATITVFYIVRPYIVTSNNDVLPVPDQYYARLMEYVMAKAYELDEDWEANQIQMGKFNAGNLEMSNQENNIQGSFLAVRDDPEDMYAR